jgi:hypothetical protein
MLSLPDAAVSWKWLVEMPTLHTADNSQGSNGNTGNKPNSLFEEIQQNISSTIDNAVSSVTDVTKFVTGNLVPKQLMMMAQQIQLPFESISSTSYKTQARERKFPDKVNVNNLSITFYEDINYTCLNYLENWKKCVINDYGVFSLPNDKNGNGYAKDIKIYLFDTVGLQKGIVTMKNCYCEDVQSYSLDSESRVLFTTGSFAVHRLTFERTALATITEDFAVVKTTTTNILKNLS